jgi:dTDP-4-amino-4,6-dideoxygalactose transaminase
MWKIPLSDLDFDQAETQAVMDVLKSGWLSMGEVTAAFEEAMRSYLGVRHAFAVANGTAALHLAHAALGLQSGDQVVLPALTFVAAANSVLYTGATPIFADVLSPNDLTISAEDVLKKITPRTRTIHVMHYGGYLCDMPILVEFAHQHGLSIVEDAAHAPGAARDGKKAGCWGDVSCFSFFANKNLVTGEGGMVVTDRDDLANHIRLMRSHGMTSLTWDRHTGHSSTYDVVTLGYNYRMDELRAALGLIQLDKLETNNQKRRKLVIAYRQLLQDTPGILIPFERHPGISAAHLMPIILNDPLRRQRVVDGLKKSGIQTSLHYPPIHLFKYYQQNYHSKPGDLPITEEIVSRLVTLPLFPSMTFEQVEQVCTEIRACLDEN